MSPAARRPAALAALVAALILAPALRRAPLPASAQGPVEPTPSACRVHVEVSLSPKLVCPHQPVAVSFRLQATCPAERAGLRVDALRLISPFPEGIIAYEPLPEGPALPDGGTEAPEPWRYELSDEVPSISEATLWVRPLHPGVFDIGAADVEIVDSEGGVATASVAPTRLLVAEGCRADRPATVYLPALLSPSCAPSSIPTDFVLALDRSTSIGDAGLAAELAATEGFLARLVPGRDRVAIVAFDEVARIVAPLGTPADGARAALAGLGGRMPVPGTRLDRAIDAGLAALADDPGRGARRAILVLISDGVHFGPGGQEPVLRAAARAGALGVGIATIVVGGVTDRRLMARLAAPGLAHVASDGNGLATAFRDLADDTGTVCTN